MKALLFKSFHHLPYKHDHITSVDENLLQASYKGPLLLGQHTVLH